MSWDMEDNDDGFRLFQENPNAFPHVQTPQGLIELIPSEQPVSTKGETLRLMRDRSLVTRL